MARMIADVPALRMSSELNRVMERAAALEKGGHKIVHLERGEPDFDTPPHIVAALAQAARAGQTHYPDARGSRDLREALAEKLGHENHIPCTARDVVVTVGGTHALYLAMQSLLGPGDEVLALSPYWMALPKIVGLTRQGTMRELPVYLDIQSGALDAAGFYARLSEAVGPATRGFYLNTPNNPTGVVLSGAHLEALARVCVERDLWVVSDEAYEHLVFDRARHVSLASLPGMAERTVSLFTFSKSYAMTGWRLGYMVAPPQAADVLGPLLSFYSTHGVFPSVQTAGVAALKGPQESVRTMCAAYQERRDLLLAGLRDVPGIRVPAPQGAFYAFADVGGVLNGRDLWGLAEEWLDLGVGVLPGSAFGAYPHQVRISLATKREDLALATRLLAQRYAPAGADR